MVSTSSSEPPTVPTAPLSAGLRFLWDPYRFMITAQGRYGDAFQLELGLTRFVILSHPSHIAHVLRTRARNYPKEGSLWDGLRGLLGNGLIVSEGPHWLRQRRMMQPHFNRQRLAAVTDCMSAAIEEVLDGWAGEIGRPVNMNDLCPHLTMAVIVRAIFGTAIDQNDVHAVGQALAHALAYVMRGMMLQAVPDWLPLPGRRGYRESLATIDEVVYRMIARRRSEPSGNDLLSMLIALRDAETDEGMSDEELHDEVVNLFLAGYETTATGMAWAFWTLAGQPAIVRRVREEVTAVTGGARPGFEHVAQLRYTRMVVKESFRRYTPAWQIMRTAREDDEIGGLRIPAGTQVMLSFCGSHLHPDFWPDPLRFDPLRFTEEAEQARPRDAWMPFGTGQRMCIGKELSLMEGSLILAQVLSRYDIARVHGRPAQPKLSLVTTSRDGIWLDLRPAT